MKQHPAEPDRRARRNAPCPTLQAGAGIRPAAAAGFASAVLARYRLKHARQGDERVWRRTSRAAPILQWSQLFKVEVAPSLRLVVDAGARIATTSPAAGPAPQTRTASREFARGINQGAIERLVERIVHRETRLSVAPPAIERASARIAEARGGDTPDLQPRGREVTGHTPAKRVLRATPAQLPATVALSRSVPQVAAEFQRQSPGGRRWEPVGANVAPALDIGRVTREVTREVVRAIDQRIVAHRERMGRT